jgi:hypothetical protein
VNTLFFKLVLAVALSLAMSLPGFAEPKTQLTAAEMAKELHNPLSSLREVIFQLDILPNVGPNDKTDWVQTIQPVYPFDLGNDWRLVTYSIIPVVAPRLAFKSIFGEVADGPLGDLLTRNRGQSLV